MPSFILDQGTIFLIYSLCPVRICKCFINRRWFHYAHVCIRYHPVCAYLGCTNIILETCLRTTWYILLLHQSKHQPKYRQPITPIAATIGRLRSGTMQHGKICYHGSARQSSSSIGQSCGSAVASPSQTPASCGYIKSPDNSKGTTLGSSLIMWSPPTSRFAIKRRKGQNKRLAS